MEVVANGFDFIRSLLGYCARGASSVAQGPSGNRNEKISLHGRPSQNGVITIFDDNGNGASAPFVASITPKDGENQEPYGHRKMNYAYFGAVARACILVTKLDEAFFPVSRRRLEQPMKIERQSHRRHPQSRPEMMPRPDPLRGLPRIELFAVQPSVIQGP